MLKSLVSLIILLRKKSSVMPHVVLVVFLLYGFDDYVFAYVLDVLALLRYIALSGVLGVKFAL